MIGRETIMIGRKTIMRRWPSCYGDGVFAVRWRSGATVIMILIIIYSSTTNEYYYAKTAEKLNI